VWLVLGALVVAGVSRAVTIGWAVLVLVVMIIPVTSLGSGVLGDEVVLGNARLWLAVALAAFVPFVSRATRPGTAAPAGAANRSGA
jgi:alpha-1,2-mannosyltransferase